MRTIEGGWKSDMGGLVKIDISLETTGKFKACEAAKFCAKAMERPAKKNETYEMRAKMVKWKMGDGVMSGVAAAMSYEREEMLDVSDAMRGKRSEMQKILQAVYTSTGCKLAKNLTGNCT